MRFPKNRNSSGQFIEIGYLSPVKKHLFFILMMILSTRAGAQSDPHSFSRPQEAVITHLSLNLTVDFETRRLDGTATVSYSAQKGTAFLVLDTRDLTITDISNEQGPVKFSMDQTVPFLGQALRIPITNTTGKFNIRYHTSPNATALQWLEAGQTADKKMPFLFSQSQAILARTWAPVQDSPGIRFTYDATLHVPPGMMAVMSADNPTKLAKDGIYRFTMNQPIPAYLLAIAVGDFRFHALDRRCGVYAEPSMLEKSVYEFTDLPKMIQAAEKLYGPYAWDRYDLIILPPSFPFGGMENPRITFATPTIIAGDRSLTTLVAHELAHSWSGNLVTNETWNDFWLNEGFTVYFENRIMEELYGKDFADMQRSLGQKDLSGTIEELGNDNPDTRLKLSLEGRDPDDGMTDIAYEKGNNLLMVIEANVGRKRWDDFLNRYFRRHAFKTMSTESFLVELKDSLFMDNQKSYDSLLIEEWIYKPGLPSNYSPVVSKNFERVNIVAEQWIEGAPASGLSVSGWSAFEWVHFIQLIPPTVGKERLSDLDKQFHFSASGNNEILFNWMLVCLANQDTSIYPVLEKFLDVVGRRKYVRPLFQELVKTPQGKEEAQKIFARSGKNYHPITEETVRGILNQP